VRLEFLTIMGMLTSGLRQWRHDMPKDSKRPVYRKGAMFEVLFMDPDSELVLRMLELVELQLDEEKRKLLT
jgi:hypothetical protein